MILDSSAIVGILRDEADADELLDAVLKADVVRLSTATYVEASIFFERNGSPIAIRRFDDLLRAARVQLEPVTARQAAIAREAYRDFGKGTGHPAQLNFGDCFTYALAKDLDEPVLFKGSDFSRTDLKPARAVRS